MANPTLALTLIERTDFLLRLVRCTGRTQPLRIEALHELPISATSELGSHAAAITASISGAEVVCAIRPKSGKLHLSTLEEANRYRGTAGARQFAATTNATSGIPGWWALGPASVGDADPRWIAEFASAQSRSEISTAFDALEVKPSQWMSARLSNIGALCGTSQTPTWLLDIGETESYATLIAKGGARALGPVSITLDKIAEAVQTELGLKFRGSAAKLFFNDQYDFSEVASKIGEKLAAALRGELANLGAKHDAGTALTCVGLPAKQSWLAHQLAEALHLESFHPDIKAWSNQAGITFAKPELEALVSPAWLGCLQLLSSKSPENKSAARWQVEWTKLVDLPTPEIRPAANVATAVPAPSGKNGKSSAVSESAAKNTPAVVGSNAPAKEKPAAPVTAAQASAPKTIPPLSVIADEPSASAAGPRTQASVAPTESSVRYPVSSAATAKSAPLESSVRYSSKPAPKKQAPTASASSSSIKPLSANGQAVSSSRSTAYDADEPAAKTRGGKKSLVIGLVAAVALGIGAYAYFYVQGQKAEAARLLAEKAQVEQRAKTEAEKARLAEEQARAEAERRKQFEVETLQKLATSEAARQHAESEARAQTAARLANARGTFVISTDPVGATVTIEGHPTQTTPATFVDLKVGHYKATISHPHCEPVKIDVDVTENNTTDGGTVRLTRITGTLSVTTDPAGIGFEIAPANTMLVMPDARRSGRTPASFDDLTPGDYTVTFTVDGGPPHVEKVAIARNATAQATWSVSNGVVKIISTPAGATISRNGTKLGVTPLILPDQAPGNVTFDISLPGYTPTRVSGHVDRGQLLTLGRNLESLDHIATIGELDQLPSPQVSPRPSFAPGQEHEAGIVILTLVVGRDGVPRSPEVVKSSDRILTDACLEAVKKWKFKPGTIGGQPVNCRVQIPFTFEAQ